MRTVELTEHEKTLAKKKNHEIIRYYRNQVSRLQSRIDYLEGKEFYDSIKEQVIQEYNNQWDKWIDEARKIWGVKGFIDTQKLLDFTEKLSKEKRSDE